jgi:hypothetical protein
MSDPSLALQRAIVAALRGYAAAGAGRAASMTQAPAGAAFPYVTLGEGHVLGDDTEDCGEGSEVFIQIDAWSRAEGFPQTKQIAAAIRGGLKATPLVLTGFVVTVTELCRRVSFCAIRTARRVTRLSSFVF